MQEVWRQSPLLSPCCAPRITWVVAGVAGVTNRNVTAFEALRLPVPSIECLAYRHGVAVLHLIDRRCQKAASGSLLDVLTLPSHHRAAAFYVVRAVVPDSLTR